MLSGDSFRWKCWALLHLYLSYFGKVSPKAMMQTQEKTIQPYRLAIVLISCGLSSIAIGVSLMLLIHANSIFLLFALRKLLIFLLPGCLYCCFPGLPCLLWA